MGGEFEDTIERPGKAKGKPGGGTLGKIRFHKSGDEIHFHDDDAKLKVAMPADLWIELWGALSTGRITQFSFVDPDKGTSLEVELTAESGTVEVDLVIDKVKVGKAFEKLQKFTEAT